MCEKIKWCFIVLHFSSSSSSNRAPVTLFIAADLDQSRTECRGSEIFLSPVIKGSGPLNILQFISVLFFFTLTKLVVKVT